MQEEDSRGSSIVKKKYWKVVASSANQGEYHHPKSGKSTKSKLDEMCASSHWKPPSFDCCILQGPNHNRQFGYKVNVVVEESVPRKKATVVIECFREVSSVKKKAKEHTAEGALWYLKHLGYAAFKD